MSNAGHVLEAREQRNGSCHVARIIRSEGGHFRKYVPLIRYRLEVFCAHLRVVALFGALTTESERMKRPVFMNEVHRYTEITVIGSRCPVVGCKRDVRGSRQKLNDLLSLVGKEIMDASADEFSVWQLVRIVA